MHFIRRMPWHEEPILMISSYEERISVMNMAKVPSAMSLWVSLREIMSVSPMIQQASECMHLEK